MANKKEETFEESLTRLEGIVKDLENGTVALDDAIKKFTEAIEISKSCDEKLKNAEEAITKLVKENGDVVDFQVEE